MRQWLYLSIVVVAMSLSVFGQVFTGNIAGVVTEPSGASIANAKVILTNTATGETREITTNDEGRYAFSQVKPAVYSLKITANGFKEYVRSEIVLSVNQSAEINIPLTVGNLADTVEVTAAAPLLDTTTQTQSSTLDQRQVTELPINARNPFVLVHATAGVVAVRTGISTANQDQNHNRFSMNGGRDETVLVLIDGIPSSAGDWGGLVASPSVDSVQEAQIIRNTYEAQFGKTGGGVVNLVTKGGAKDWHATGFEYLRNDNLDANSWFNNFNRARKPEFKRNQFGGNVSGPIWGSKKLFGFFNYEGLRQTTPASRQVTVATDLERQGDFSQTFNANGSLMTIYDPLTTRLDSATGLYVRDPFPGNRIPSNRFDPVALKVLALMPAANRPGDAVTRLNNYFNTGVDRISNDRYDARVDWNWHEKLTVFGRFTKARQDGILAQFFETVAETNRNDFNPRSSGAVGVTYIVNPTLIINALVGGGHWTEQQLSKALGTDPVATLGLPANLTGRFDIQALPIIGLADGYTSIGNNQSNITARGVYNGQINISKELANHSLKFGWTLEHSVLNFPTTTSGNFNFDRFFTSGPNPDARASNAGNVIASLLLGAGSGGGVPRNIAPAVTQAYWGWYAQDQWRVNQKLTLNYGLRYELQRGRTERYDRLNYFDPNVTNPLGQRVGLNLKGGLVYVNEDNRYQWEPSKRDFAPRVGFAYKANDKLVVRAGYGVYYLMSVNVGAIGTDGYSLTTPWVTSLDGGRTAANYLRNPFPGGVLEGPGNANGAATNAGLAVSTFSRKRPTSYMQQYSLDLQYQLGNSLVAEVGYVGSQGRRLSYGFNYELNQIPDSALAQGRSLLDLVPNPFFGTITTGTLAGATVQRGQLLRPFPQFTSVTIQDMPGASSSYNALTAKLTQRFSQGLTLIASYQYSRAIDNASENQAWEISDRARNFNNLALEKSISGHDIPHSLAINYIYDLPIGKGKKLAGNLHPAVNAVIGGWQVSGIYKYDSGLPLTFTANNNTFSFGGSQQPNVLDIEKAGQGKTNFNGSGEKKINQWFDTTQFVQPADFTFGNAPRWFGNIRADHTNNFDFSLGKNWLVKEKFRVQFRGEFFNLFNRVQFGRANTNINNSGFGQVRGTINTLSRNIQFGLRLSF
jgi:hypothetical protein